MTSRPPFHRVVSRWATSVVCGALVAALAMVVLFVGEELGRQGRFDDDMLVISGILGAGFLAFLAPLEAAAALGRRFGVRVAVLLILLVPPAAVVLFMAGADWLDALRAGDPRSFGDRLGQSLAGSNIRLEPFVCFLALAAPLGVARALDGRPWRARVAAAAGGLAVWVYVYWTRSATEAHELWPTFVIAAATIAASFGLALGDALELRLADRIGRWLRAARAPEPEPDRSDSPHPPRDASDNDHADSAQNRPGDPHPPLTSKDF